MQSSWYASLMKNICGISISSVVSHRMMHVQCTSYNQSSSLQSAEDRMFGSFEKSESLFRCSRSCCEKSYPVSLVGTANGRVTV